MEKSCVNGAGQKGLHEYGEYLKRKCYREREREARSAFVEKGRGGGGREGDEFRHIDPPAAVW